MSRWGPALPCWHERSTCNFPPVRHDCDSFSTQYVYVFSHRSARPAKHLLQRHDMSALEDFSRQTGRNYHALLGTNYVSSWQKLWPNVSPRPSGLCHWYQQCWRVDSATRFDLQQNGLLEERKLRQPGWVQLFRLRQDDRRVCRNGLVRAVLWKWWWDHVCCHDNIA